MIHLVAMAGRCGVELGLGDFDRLSRCTPVLANIRPGGEYLMEDFYYAGGLPALLAQMRDLLHLERMTANGRALGDNLVDAVIYDERVIRPRNNPLAEEGGIAVLHGNLAPDGAVIKHLAASPGLHRHTGRAVVFEDYQDMQRRINEPDLDVTADSVLVLRHAGPQGGPGMPEYGMLPIPDKLLRAGVRDMVRISDARMSGTSYGTCVLHVAPESFVGGPLALVANGDLITLDVAERRLHLEVSESELARAGRRRGHLRQRSSSVGTAACTASTSAKPTRGATSIFLPEPGPPSSPNRDEANLHHPERGGRTKDAVRVSTSSGTIVITGAAGDSELTCGPHLVTRDRGAVAGRRRAGCAGGH